MEPTGDDDECEVASVVQDAARLLASAAELQAMAVRARGNGGDAAAAAGTLAQRIAAYRSSIAAVLGELAARGDSDAANLGPFAAPLPSAHGAASDVLPGGAQAPGSGGRPPAGGDAASAGAAPTGGAREAPAASAATAPAAAAATTATPPLGFMPPGPAPAARSPAPAAAAADADDPDPGPSAWQVPLHCVPIHANVTTFDWPALAAAAQFDAVMMDPPWQLATANPTRGVALGYSQLSDDAIAALPVPELQQGGGLLFLWVINAKYKFTLDLFDSWGYE